ncbi:MAG: TIGR04211 family SH3 domain-containing protein [Proteobacteria bacterium]|nr:TIGR04211 family SH3 domain-containing protein [Pseudomonadota bacterium]
MKIKSIYPSALTIVAIMLAFPGHAAQIKYITDEFEVTMRSGTSVSNSIVRMLKSGQAVTILEEDLASRYSLVEIEGGKKGYVLSRYLVDTMSSKVRLEILQKSADEQKTLTASLQADVERLESDLKLEQSDKEALKNTLLASESELSRVRDAASNTLDIVAKNKRLESVVTQLGKDNAALDNENAALKDTTKLDWLVRGAGVSLVAFIIGILVTRIRWRKQESWGSY